MTPDDENEPFFSAVREALSRNVPEFDQARVGRRVREAYAAGRKRPRSKARYALATAGVVFALLVAALSVSRLYPRRTTFEVAGRTGQVGSPFAATSSDPLPLMFSEGSQVLLNVGSRAQVAEVTATGARVELEDGSVTAEVVHRENTNWTFIAGPFEVAVLGTRLGVSWSPQARHFEVRVTSGKVRVRGPLLAVGQEVRSGQVCRVDLERGLVELGDDKVPPVVTRAHPEPVPTTPTSSSDAVPTASGAPSGARTEPAKTTWVALAKAGKPRDAIAAAERAGLPSVYQSSSPEALLELARSARVAGRADIERAALLECRRRAPGQPSAAQAAYLLGRASTPSEAVTWFESYIQEQPRGLMAREAAGRLIESYVASRNTVGAKRAAAKYLRDYPAGPHAAMARHVLGPENGQVGG